MVVTNKAARVKQEVITAVQYFLYHDISQSLVTREKAIVIRNSVLLKSGQMSCSYKGVSYFYDNNPAQRGKITHLSPELHAEMDDLLKDKVQIFVYEMAFVMGYVRQALNIAGTLSDMLDLLPESVHYPINKMLGSRNLIVPRLAPEVIRELIDKNTKAIELMKTRMVLNLLM